MAEVMLALSAIAGAAGAGTAAGTAVTGISGAVGTAVGSGLAGTLGTAASLLPGVGAVAAAGSVLGGAYGAIQTKKQSEMQAASLERRGDMEKVKAQRQAMHERRQAELLASRANAIAAKDGGMSPGDSSAVNFAQMKNEAKINELTALWNGQMARDEDYFEAGVTRRTGRSRAIGGLIDTATTAYSDFMTNRLLRKYPGYGTYGAYS